MQQQILRRFVDIRHTDTNVLSTAETILVGHLDRKVMMIRALIVETGTCFGVYLVTDQFELTGRIISQLVTEALPTILVRGTQRTHQHPATIGLIDTAREADAHR